MRGTHRGVTEEHTHPANPYIHRENRGGKKSKLIKTVQDCLRGMAARLTRRPPISKMDALKGQFPFTGKKEQIERNPQTERGDNPKMRARASPKTGANPDQAYKNNSN